MLFRSFPSHDTPAEVRCILETQILFIVDTWEHATETEVFKFGQSNYIRPKALGRVYRGRDVTLKTPQDILQQCYIRMTNGHEFDARGFRWDTETELKAIYEQLNGEDAKATDKKHLRGIYLPRNQEYL